MDYTAELLKVCGIALLCSACLLVIGKLCTSVGTLIRVGGGVLIFGVFIFVLSANINSLEETFNAAPVNSDYFGEAFSLMLKALGIALLCRFCADVCRDCGEGTMANGVESVGRMAIFSLCIPIITDILAYASQVMEIGG